MCACLLVISKDIFFGAISKHIHVQFIYHVYYE
jgi:hypothetical protein